MTGNTGFSDTATPPVKPDPRETAAALAVKRVFRSREALQVALPGKDVSPSKDVRMWENGGCLVAAEAILLFLSAACPAGGAKIHCVRHRRRIHFVTIMGRLAYEWNGPRAVGETAADWGGPRTAASVKPTTPTRANLSAYRNEEMSEKLAEMLLREYYRLATKKRFAKITHHCLMDTGWKPEARSLLPPPRTRSKQHSVSD